MLGTFIHTYRWGRQIRGDERGYVEKVKRYQALGIDFFTLERNPSLQDGMNESIYHSLKLRNSPIPPQSIGDLLLLSLHSIRAAFRKVPSRPLAIYAYNQDVENLWIAYLLSVLFGSLLVVIHHQIRPAAFASLRGGIIDRTQRGFNPAGVVLRSLLPALNRFAAGRADVHIALSEATKNDVAKYLGIKDCVVVGNGLDTVKFRPLNLPKTIDAVFLGRLAPQKGIDVLLRAWREVVKAIPDCRLVMLGGGDKEDVILYTNLTKELSLERNVTFAGFVNDEELVRILNSSKLFVFPSRFEGFAQAVSQAMGCGLCCILSDIPPLREIYGEAAVFVPAEQPVALAETIATMLGAQDKRELLAKKSRQLAERFSWEDTVRGELAQVSKELRRRRG